MNILPKRSPPGSGWAELILLVLVLFGLVAIPGCYSLGGKQPPPPEISPALPKLGQEAPDFTLTDLNGNQVKLSDFRGKTVFLNFWATWCPACIAEMREIEALYQEYKDKDVIIMGIDLFEPENEVREFVERGGYSWTFVIDTTGEVTRNYGVTAIPTSFFVDKKGVIRVVKIGAMTKQAMEVRLIQAMK